MAALTKTQLEYAKTRIAAAKAAYIHRHMAALGEEPDVTEYTEEQKEALIRQALQNLMHGRTSFIIAHRIQTVMDADLILVFHQGHIVQRGNHEQLVAQEGFYRRIYEAQTRMEQEFEAQLSAINN